MMAEELNTICPFCSYHHDAITDVRSDTAFPDDGDVTLCFNCGRWCVFDGETDGGLRKPTKAEQRLFERDRDLKKITQAWKVVRRQ